MSSTNGWLTMLRTEIKSERKMTNPDTLAQDYATARETAAFAEGAEEMREMAAKICDWMNQLIQNR